MARSGEVAAPPPLSSQDRKMLHRPPEIIPQRLIDVLIQMVCKHAFLLMSPHHHEKSLVYSSRVERRSMLAVAWKFGHLQKRNGAMEARVNAFAGCNPRAWHPFL
jgi:hypothetical protein